MITLRKASQQTVEQVIVVGTKQASGIVLAFFLFRTRLDSGHTRYLLTAEKGCPFRSLRRIEDQGGGIGRRAPYLLMEYRGRKVGPDPARWVASLTFELSVSGWKVGVISGLDEMPFLIPLCSLADRLTVSLPPGFRFGGHRGGVL